MALPGPWLTAGAGRACIPLPTSFPSISGLLHMEGFDSQAAPQTQGHPPAPPSRGSAHRGAARQPRLWQSAAAFPKDSYFFFSSSIKSRSDSIRVERREAGNNACSTGWEGKASSVMPQRTRRCPGEPGTEWLQQLGSGGTQGSEVWVGAAGLPPKLL